MISQKDLIHSVPWKTLIILDACRYDIFKEISELPGMLRSVQSAGSCTIEWAPRTFPGVYKDIVYISSIPYIGRHEIDGWRAVEHFDTVVPLWDIGWNDELGTVLPGHVYEASRIEKKKDPEKRFIVHFVQPHEPFIGETQIGLWKGLKESRRSIKDGGSGYVVYNRNSDCPATMRKQAYIDNLKLVLEYVQKMIDPQTVVTADHGEYLGEYGLKGHPCRLNDPILRTVPWLSCGRL